MTAFPPGSPTQIVSALLISMTPFHISHLVRNLEEEKEDVVDHLPLVASY